MQHKKLDPLLISMAGLIAELHRAACDEGPRSTVARRFRQLEADIEAGVPGAFRVEEAMRLFHRSLGEEDLDRQAQPRPRTELRRLPPAQARRGWLARLADAVTEGLQASTQDAEQAMKDLARWLDRRLEAAFDLEMASAGDPSRGADGPGQDQATVGVQLICGMELPGLPDGRMPQRWNVHEPFHLHDGERGLQLRGSLEVELPADVRSALCTTGDFPSMAIFAYAPKDLGKDLVLAAAVWPLIGDGEEDATAALRARFELTLPGVSREWADRHWGFAGWEFAWVIRNPQR